MPTSLHGLTHDGLDRTERLSRVYARQSRHLAGFVERLRDTPEGEGTMLDDLVMTSVYEGDEAAASRATTIARPTRTRT